MTVPPHEIPVGKKLMVEKAGRSLQRLGNMASNTTSSGTLKDLPGRARAERTRSGIDLRHDLASMSDSRSPIRLEQGGCFDRIGLEPRTRSVVGNVRQRNSGHHRDDREDANHFEKGKPFFCVRTASHCLPRLYPLLSQSRLPAHRRHMT